MAYQVNRYIVVIFLLNALDLYEYLFFLFLYYELLSELIVVNFECCLCYQLVRQKIEDLKEKDFKRLLQPVIDGNEIMEMYNLKPSREVGILKQYLKDAVLDNKVENEREPLLALLNEKAKELGLVSE